MAEKLEDAGIFRAEDNSTKPKFYWIGGVPLSFRRRYACRSYQGLFFDWSCFEKNAVCRAIMSCSDWLWCVRLPTENYAIKQIRIRGIITDQNIAHFTEQLKSVGFFFDWSRVIDTTDEDYYKWTQWIFLKLFEHGLVYQDKTWVNYCPSCKVVLSNEDSQGDSVISATVKLSRNPKQSGIFVLHMPISFFRDLKAFWFSAEHKNSSRLTGSKVRALSELPSGWHRGWCPYLYDTSDTLFGVTFMVVAPEHPLDW